MDDNELFENDVIEANDDDYGPDLVTVVDEDGVEHVFEELDRIETEDGRFVALLPVYDEAEEIFDSDGELIILRVLEENDEFVLEPIENEELFEKIGDIFEERLADLFEFQDEDEE